MSITDKQADFLATLRDRAAKRAAKSPYADESNRRTDSMIAWQFAQAARKGRAALDDWADKANLLWLAPTLDDTADSIEARARDTRARILALTDDDIAALPRAEASRLISAAKILLP